MPKAIRTIYNFIKLPDWRRQEHFAALPKKINFILQIAFDSEQKTVQSTHGTTQSIKL